MIISLTLVLSACELTGQTAEPTAIPENVTTNPVVAAESANAGDERTTVGDGMVEIYYIPGGKFQMGG